MICYVLFDCISRLSEADNLCYGAALPCYLNFHQLIRSPILIPVTLYLTYNEMENNFHLGTKVIEINMFFLLQSRLGRGVQKYRTYPIQTVRYGPVLPGRLCSGFK